MKQLSQDQGFTLIEVMIAMGVLAIGILALYAMQASATKSNSFAFGQTVAANLGMDQVEIILASPYDPIIAGSNGIDDDRNGTIDDASDDMLSDTNGDGAAGLNNTVAAGVVNSDYSRLNVPDEQGVIYNIYWNIAEDTTPGDTPLMNIKRVRVIVTRTDLGAIRPVALTYYKQKEF